MPQTAETPEQATKSAISQATRRAAPPPGPKPVARVYADNFGLPAIHVMGGIRPGAPLSAISWRSFLPEGTLLYLEPAVDTPRAEGLTDAWLALAHRRSQVPGSTPLSVLRGVAARALQEFGEHEGMARAMHEHFERTRSADAALAGTVKRWRERQSEAAWSQGFAPVAADYYMQQEIDELRTVIVALTGGVLPSAVVEALAAAKAAAAPVAPAPVHPDPQALRKAIRASVAEALGGLYLCRRTWHTGTMSEQDFTPASQVDEVLDSITDAALAALAQVQASPAVQA